MHAPGTPDTVQVIIAVLRHIEIDDEIEIRDIQAAGCDIGGNQYRDIAQAEFSQQLVSDILVDVAVDHH